MHFDAENTCVPRRVDKFLFFFVLVCMNCTLRQDKHCHNLWNRKQHVGIFFFSLVLSIFSVAFYLAAECFIYGMIARCLTCMKAYRSGNRGAFGVPVEKKVCIRHELFLEFDATCVTCFHVFGLYASLEAIYS